MKYSVYMQDGAITIIT